MRTNRRSDFEPLWISTQVVHVSSQSSSQAIRDRCAYSLTKAGVDYLTKCMALELGPHGIRTNCVNPTVVLTPLGRAAWADAAKRDPMLASIPLGRFAVDWQAAFRTL